MITEIRQHIDKNLATFMEKVKKDYKLHLVSPLLYESLREFSLRPGKRIRPLLLILSYRGYTPQDKRISPSIYNASTCIELLHSFMLIHDDIIDCSNLRRGKPTLHRILSKTVKTSEAEKLGCNLGIIAGDILYAFAIDAFLAIKETPQRKERALKHFIQTAAFTAMGEFIDTVHGEETVQRVKEKDVFLNYSLKTARYTFDCPLVVGAILGGAPATEIKRLSQLGLLVGQAFQIQDDIIGIFDSQKNIGKSILSDLAESKKTLLVCHAYNQLPLPQKKLFLKEFNKPTKNYQDLVNMRKTFLSTGTLQYCFQEILSRLDQSNSLLDKISMNPRYKKTITDAIFNLFKHSERIAKKNHIPFPLTYPPSKP